MIITHEQAVTIKLEIECEECGDTLEARVNSADCVLWLNIDPCAKCIKEAIAAANVETQWSNSDVQEIAETLRIVPGDLK